MSLFRRRTNRVQPSSRKRRRDRNLDLSLLKQKGWFSFLTSEQGDGFEELREEE